VMLFKKTNGFIKNVCEVLFMEMKDVIARINELAAKNKTVGLTAEELAERDKLRRIYIDSYKQNLVAQLENTYIVQPDGTKVKVKHK